MHSKRTSIHILSLALLLGTALGGCDKKQPPAAGAPSPAVASPAAPAVAPSAAASTVSAGEALASCTNPGKTTCMEYPGLSAADAASSAKMACDMTSGAVAQGACPTAKRLGTCTFPAAMHKRESYYPGGDDNYTAATAEKECSTLSGTFAP